MSQVPYTFATASGNVPASQLDANFANVKASVDSAVVVTAEAQPNIRSVGTLSNLTVTGNVIAANFIGTIVGNVSNAVFATTAATVTTAAQPNITALGTLTSLVSSGNITSGANISGSYILGNGSQLTGITANYNNSNVTTLLSSFGSNTISTTGNITGGNFIGTISNAVFATTAATVTTAAQPNITSVGTLTSLTVTGNITGGNLLTGGLISAVGNINTDSNKLTLALTAANATVANLSGIYVGNGIASFVYNSTDDRWFSGNQGLATTANVNSGNLRTTGLISATGNINTDSSRITLSLTAANATVANLSGIYVGDSGNIASFVYNSADNRWFAGNQGLATLANVNSGNLRTTGLISATGNITANNFIGGGAGNLTLSSATNLDLSAVTAVRVTGGGTFRLPSLSAGEIANIVAVNGDLIYNTTVNKFQGYENGAWGNLI
jgi:hypothetical protein